jgi:hypothetical protein
MTSSALSIFIFRENQHFRDLPHLIIRRVPKLASDAKKNGSLSFLLTAKGIGYLAKSLIKQRQEGSNAFFPPLQ